MKATCLYIVCGNCNRVTFYCEKENGEFVFCSLRENDNSENGSLVVCVCVLYIFPIERSPSVHISSASSLNICIVSHSTLTHASLKAQNFMNTQNFVAANI